MAARITAVVILPSRTGPWDEASATECLRRASEAFPGIPVFSSRVLGEARVVEGETDFAIVRTALLETAQDPDDSVAVLTGLYPLLDPGLSREASAEHLDFLAHVTLSENLPAGIVPDFVSREFSALVPADLPDFRAHVQKNMNKYDVELFYRLPDLRQMRLDFTLSTARSLRLARDVRSISPNATFSDLAGILREHPEILRPFPSYFELELSVGGDIRPIFWPARAGENRHLSSDVIRRLCDDIGSHGMARDATVAFGGLGEPLDHPDFYSSLRMFLESENVGTVFVETFGLGWTAETTATLAALPGVEKLSVIFRLSTLDRERYKKIYHVDGLSAVLSVLDGFAKNPPAFQVYAEMLRMKEVEDEISLYHDKFEKSPVQVIIQKYNTYLGKLPERRVSDLTPLHRDFCWHLARDLMVNVDGRSPLCRQDPFCEKTGRDFLPAGISGFLEWTRQAHAHSFRGEHEKTGMPCLSCDEWYTFNG